MPEPITASVVASTLAKGAIAKVGGKILESVLPGVFSKDRSFEEIKESLERIEVQLEEIASIARSTFVLVDRLPSVVRRIVDDQTLYVARTRIEASMTVYLSLDEPPTRISHGELTALVQSWTVLVDKEYRASVIQEMPRYGEFMLAATNGQLVGAVVDGARAKLAAVQSARQSAEVTIVNQASEAERLIQGPYVRNGNVLDDAPWLSWASMPHRTRMERRCVTLPCHMCNGDTVNCWDEAVPDTPFNQGVDSAKSRLAALQKLLGESASLLRSLVIAQKILEVFVESLEGRVESLKTLEHIRVMEMPAAFGT